MYQWTVYRHVGPTAKVYIGITKNSVYSRWGHNGVGYRGSPKFWNAIQKYGWDNFRHEIIAERLTQEEAQQMEIELIAKYTKQNKTYNIMPGGNSYPAEHKPNGPMPEWHKQKISKALKGKPKSPEHIEKVRQSNIGRTNNYIWIKKDDETKRIPKADFYDYMIGGWALGREPMAEGARQKLSEHFAGLHLSEEHKKRLSIAGKGKMKDRISVTKDCRNKRITKEQLQEFLDAGWERGWYIGVKLEWINKEGRSKRVPLDQIQIYINDGWALGRNYHHSKETCAKISATHSGQKHGPLSEETRKKIGDANRGKKRTSKQNA